MSDPQSLPEPCGASLHAGAPAAGLSCQDVLCFHGDDAPAWHELPLTDDLLDRLRAAGY